MIPWDTQYGVRYLANRSKFVTALNIEEAMADAVVAANSNTARQVLAMAEVFATGIAPAKRREMNHVLGLMGQESVLKSYDASVTGRQNRLGNAYAYRRGAHGKNRRYAGGKLRKVLASKSFFHATPDGLTFINEGALNRAARQWARLNAGAGAAAGGYRAPLAVTWSNVVIGVFGVEMPARPGFMLPRGYWFSRTEGNVVSASEARRGSDEFYPMGTGPFPNRTRLERNVKGGDPKGPGLARRRPSKGIRGRHFLDAGTERIAREYAPAMEKLYRELYAAATVGPYSDTVRSAPRPRRLKKSTFPV